MNKPTLILASGLCITMAILAGCDKKVGKLPSTATPPPAGFCDTITYTKHIGPIIATNCALSGCHDAGSANGDYTSYAGVNAKVSTGTFKLRVLDSPGNPMPASGMLPQSQLDIIKCWLDNGAPNN